MLPAETQAKVMAAATKNSQDPMADEFDKRMKLADQAIKIEDIRSNERIAAMQMESKKAQKKADAEFKQQFAQ
jgi:hypothetical protein